MNSNKISLIIVLLSFIIGGGLVVSAKLKTPDRQAESSIVESETNNAPDDTSSEADSSSEESEPDSSSQQSEPESSSTPDSSDNALPRDEKGKELPIDVTPMVGAYQSGDSSALSDKERQALEKAEEVIAEIISDDMNDYEKALAIHDYIILNNEYNEDHLSIFGSSDLDDSSPYGVLIKKTSVCKGYAVTFKLLCNMCGIECELILEYEGKDIEHAYDRMKIDNDWYYVDVTWDDSAEMPWLTDHRYFSLTKAQMACNHNIDKSCPDTLTDKYTYAAQNLKEVKNEEQFTETVKSAALGESSFPVYIRLDDAMGIRLKLHNEFNAIDEYFDYDDGEDISRLEELAESAADGYYLEFSKIMVNGEAILRICVF